MDVRSRFTAAERRVVDSLGTPRRVQRWLRSIGYNWGVGPRGPTLRTFRGVIRHREANCLEAVLAAATILEQRGRPPLILDLESQDGLDHVLYLYRTGGSWGAIGKSRDIGLQGRKPVFGRVRDLVYSYVDPYVDHSGRITGYAVANLDDLTTADWRLGHTNVWSVERALFALPHRRLATSDRRHARSLARYRRLQAIELRGTPTDFPGREKWL